MKRLLVLLPVVVAAGAALIWPEAQEQREREVAKRYAGLAETVSVSLRDNEHSAIGFARERDIYFELLVIRAMPNANYTLRVSCAKDGDKIAATLRNGGGFAAWPGQEPFATFARQQDAGPFGDDPFVVEMQGASNGVSAAQLSVSAHEIRISSHRQPDSPAAAMIVRAVEAGGSFSLRVTATGEVMEFPLQDLDPAPVKLYRDHCAGLAQNA